MMTRWHLTCGDAFKMREGNDACHFLQSSGARPIDTATRCYRGKMKGICLQGRKPPSSTARCGALTCRHSPLLEVLPEEAS